MSKTARFVINRRDLVSDVDEVVLDSEGLTIGRLIGNDLVLNHPAVSRTQAGIKQLGNDFWIFNLSESNGTLLNGELVERTPLADGDVVQVGPFLLQVTHRGGGLALSVESVPDVRPQEARASAGDQSTAGTVVMNFVVPPRPRRPEGTGLLTSMLPAPDQQALQVFWDKRKREAGKIAGETPLHPHQNSRVGKAQFNWRPTFDLRILRRKGFYSWATIIVVVLGGAAIFVYDEAFSPGVLSDSHNLAASARNIAQRPVAGSCSSCHQVTSALVNQCASCHNTGAFQPAIYDAHEREGMKCASCHTEHQGPAVEAGLIAYSLCSNCHNDSYRVTTGERQGAVLGFPHGGSTGYPVVDRKWDWKLSAEQLRRKRLPEAWSAFDSKGQFHAIHTAGRMAGRMNCKDCHSQGAAGSQLWRESPRLECAKCHSLSITDRGVEAVQANCNTCHQQHGQSRDLAKVMPAGATDQKRISQILARLEQQQTENNEDRVATRNVFNGIGSASVVRQDSGGLRAALAGGIGGVPWFIWGALALALPIVALCKAGVDSLRGRRLILPGEKPAAGSRERGTRSIDLDKLEEEGPRYPHPVVDPLLCIGCHACVEACPHDVLAIVNGVATPVAVDQCMEDTSCQVECPTSPKACVVINTTKVIPKRKVPARDKNFMTNVPGMYMAGDVSGVPLIKNAINEGGQVIEQIINDLKTEGAVAGAEYDVAIIGTGPAGLSAAVLAAQRGLKYVALEQDKLAATIQAYPAGKYVFFKPDTVQTKGGLPAAGAGDKKEAIMEAWLNIVQRSGARVHEDEGCSGIARENGVFVITTEHGTPKRQTQYRARRVILAIGNRGAPMKLGVQGEEATLLVSPQPRSPKHCRHCGTATQGADQLFCVHCGAELPKTAQQPYRDSKVKYKLSDPADYAGKRCIVVGAGNSAVEAAVDLSGFKRDGDKITFSGSTEVTLVVRSDFKGDLKLATKMNVYDCIDSGRIKAFFRAEIKEIKEGEVVLMDTRTKKEVARIANDYIFALIGGEKPTKFLESIGVKIG